MEHHTVQAALRALEKGSDPDLQKQIREAAAEHDRLHSRYTAELTGHELESGDSRRIDRSVRGIDRSFDARLENLVTRASVLAANSTITVLGLHDGVYVERGVYTRGETATSSAFEGLSADGHNGLPALREVSLSIAPGEVQAPSQPAGASKGVNALVV